MVGKLTGVVSNPPYIPSSQIQGLQAEVRQHEPKLALDGGEDGIDHLLHLCQGSVSALKSGGFFAFEVTYPPLSLSYAVFTFHVKCNASQLSILRFLKILVKLSNSSRLLLDWFCIVSMTKIILIHRSVKCVLQTNGEKQSEFLADSMTIRWGDFFYNVKMVSDFAGIKRFVTGFRK